MTNPNGPIRLKPIEINLRVSPLGLQNPMQRERVVGEFAGQIRQALETAVEMQRGARTPFTKELTFKTEHALAPEHTLGDCAGAVLVKAGDLLEAGIVAAAGLYIAGHLALWALRGLEVVAR